MIKRFLVDSHFGLCFSLLLLFAMVFPVAADGDLSEELVEQRLSAIADMPESEARTSLEAEYRAVLALLRQATDYAAAEHSYTAAVVDAPATEREIRQRLEKGDESLSPDFEEKLEGVALAQLEAEFTAARAERASFNAENTRLDERLSSRETNEGQRRERILAIQAQLRELPVKLAFVQATASPSSNEAADWQVIASRQALLAEDRSLDAASASQPARYALLRAQRSDGLRSVALLDLQIDAIERRLVEFRREQAERVRSEEVSLAGESATLVFLAGQNVEYSSELEVLSADIAVLYRCRKDMEESLAFVSDRYSSTRRRVEFARGSDELGHILLAELNTSRLDPVDTGCSVDRRIGNMVIQRIDHEEQMLLLDRVESYVDEVANSVQETLSDSQRERAVELSRLQRKLLADLIALHSSYIDVAGDLVAIMREEGRVSDEYRTFLSTYLLWVHSHPPLSLDSIRAIPREMVVLSNSYRGLLAVLDPSWPGAVAILAFLVLILLRWRLSGWQERLAKDVGRARSDSISSTLLAIVATLLDSLPWPVLLFAVARAIGYVDVPLATSVSGALQGAAWLTLILLFLRNSVRENGIGTLHFQWRPENCAIAYREISWLIIWWLPLMVFSSILYRLGLASPEAGGVRLLSLLTTFIFVRRLWKIQFVSSPDDPVAGLFISRLPLLRNIFILLTGLVVFILTAGYLYSAAIIIRGILASASLVAVLIFFYATMYRWSMIMRRKVRFRELVTDSSKEEEQQVKEERASLASLSAATAKLMKFAVLILGLLGLWIIWAPTLPALDVLNEVVLWTSSSSEGGVTITQNVTMGSILGIIILAFAVFYAARDVPSLVELILLQYPSVSSGSRYTITTILGYVIFAGGGIALLSMLGLQWGQLQWLVAALGVGIGFGLQEIVANFISGLIILFERPIRVGDIVTIGESDGVITKIRIRATTLRDWNGKELVVPNKEFITGRLLNWSLSDSETRIILEVGVAYGSDVERALALLEDIVRSNADVLDEPPPSIILSEFGDNALLLTARYFVPSVEYLWLTKSVLNREIYRRFNEEDIVIAFPQRDVHFDAEAPIRIKLEQPEG
ncbi:MAG: mechanosensitive ion channel domain-containing protein [Halieaceae bacterium]